MKRTSFASLFMLMFVLLMSSVASAVPTLVSPSPNSFGEIERITLNDPADVYSGGTIVVGGVQMILPKNLLIDLPANRLSLQQIFDQAPAACKTLGESGLAKADRCNGTGSGGIATLSATRTNAGNVIVGDLFIQKAAESVVGVVTYINYDQGYYRVNGVTGDPDTGAMVRLNDPNSRHTVQSGAGCSAGSLNCSPDPRFNLDPDNYTNTFATGYPVCIPSTVSRSFTNVLGNGGLALSKANADGTGDFLCPDTNRTAALVEPPVADSRRFAPIKVGDSVVAEGNYESVGGVRFLSAHSSTVQKALATRNVQGQPDYLFLEEVGYEAPPYQNQRLIALLIGFTTLAPTDVDVWSLHRDPQLNEIHEFPFATVRGCDAASGGPGNCSSQGLVAAGANIFKIRYDIDFLKGVDPKLSPCSHLANPASRFFASHPGICSGGATTAKDIAVMSPVPHEIIARTGRKIDSATNPAIGELITLDINGNQATNGEYLFPLGLNLGGLGVAEMSEVNINELNTPIPFEGIPWNLDRRLGPSGCLNAGGCESGTVGSAAFALDPFPFSGLDPRLQATLLPNVTYTDPVFGPGTLTSSRDRMFSYVSGTNFNGNSTVMPYSLGTFPADPPFITILPTPILNMYPPVVVNDTATTNTGVSVPIDVLANDVAVFGTIDPTSVLIATGPASGTVLVNPTTGVITFTPTDPLVTNVSFTYTVANNFGSVSQPGTVTVSIIPPPLAITTASLLPAYTIGNVTDYYTKFENTGGVGPYTWSVIGAIPPGTAFFPATGELYGATGNITTPGTYAFILQVTDSTSLTSIKAFSLDIVPAALTITTANPLPEYTMGGPTDFYTKIATSGGAAPFFWTISAGALPPGITFFPATGELYGAAGNITTAGTYNFTLQVTDRTAATTSKAFTLVVAPATLAITTASPLPTYTMGGPTDFYTKIATSGGSAPFTWAITAGALPPGIALFPATGELYGASGNITTPGTYNFTLQVTDGTAATASKAFSLVITAAPLIITTASPLPVYTTGGPTDFYTKIAATGGVAPFTWAITAGAMPPGIAFFPATGELYGASGNITTPGTYNFTLQVTDGTAATASKAFSLEIL